MAHKKFWILLLNLGVICFFARGLMAAPRYSVRYLGYLPGTTESHPTNLNNLGQVVGVATNESGAHRAFLWTPEKGMQDLGTLGGDQSLAEAINNLGQVVGYSYIDAVTYRGFLWTPGQGMQDLGSFDGNSSYAHDLNDHGEVVGTSSSDEGSVAYRWTAEQGLQKLGIPGSYPTPWAINNRGEVVGEVYLPSPGLPLGVIHAYLWTPAKGFRDLGTLGDWSSAQDINDQGQVVGKTSVTGYERTTHAFLWTEAEGMKLLNAPLWPLEESYPFCINNPRAITGISNTPENSTTYDAIWNPQMSKPVIEDPHSSSIGIFRMNDHGLIIGEDLKTQQAVLLTPVPPFSPGISLVLEDQ